MPSSAETHPWGISDVEVDDPMDSHKLPITPWKSLKFHPVGIVHLRRYQGVFPYNPLFYKSKKESFEAADIAWFAAGLHKDGKHHTRATGPNSFHPEYVDLYNNCGINKETRPFRKALLKKVLNLIFDLATLLDRASGGTTLVLHAKGTCVPGSLHQAEFLKADAYFPPAFLADHPSCRPALLRIAQDFIANIGVPTVTDWNNRARAHLQWGFSMTYDQPPANQAMTDVPPPELGTSHFVFRGQPVTPDLPLAISQPSSSQHSQASTDYPFEDYDASFLTQLAYQEHISALTTELADVRQERNQLFQQVAMYERMLEIDTVPVLPLQRPTLPKTPTRLKPVTQRTPTPGPDSPFVTLRSGKSRSPFPASPSGTPVHEPTTPYSRRTQAARFASPLAGHGHIVPALHGQVRDAASHASSSSSATRIVPSGSASIVDYILGRHEVLHLKAKVLILLEILSDPSDAETLADELEKLGLPPAAIANVLKASVLDRTE